MREAKIKGFTKAKLILKNCVQKIKNSFVLSLAFSLCVKQKMWFQV
jgi:hypothetical protein